MKPYDLSDIGFQTDQGKDIIRGFKIFSCLNLIQFPGIINNNEIEFFIGKIKTAKIENSIMFNVLKISENFKLYIFVLDDTIFIINQKNLHLFRDYFKNNINYLLYMTQQDEEEFQLFLQNESSDSNYNNETSVDKATLFKSILDCILKKCRYRAITNRNKFDQHFFINDLNINDFISIKELKAGNLHLVYDKKDQLLYVMKKFDKQQQFKREIHFYTTIENKLKFTPKIIGIINNNSGQKIIREYIEGETLYKFITKKDNLENSIKIKLILEILLSIEYIHLKGIFLRDLKWDNIVVDTEFNAILIDFDSVKQILLDSDQNEEFTGDIGSYFFAAPEQVHSNFYSFKVDSYSVGLLIHFIITQVPYDLTIFNLAYLNKIYNSNENILDNEHFPKCPKKFEILRTFYKNCFDISPDSRPTVSNILNEIIFKLSENEFHIKDILKEIVDMRLKYIQSIDNLVLNDEKYFYIDKSSIFYFLGKSYINNDINKAINYLALATEMKNSDACFCLGELYYKGEYIQQDFEKANHYLSLSCKMRNLFSLSPESLNPSEQSVLGQILYLGLHDNNKPDIKNSMKCLTLAADKNEPSAQYQLGKIYWEGKILPRNFNKAIDYLTRAANQNEPNAQFFLGKIYNEGQYISKDISKAIHYLTLSSDQNQPEAQFYLAEVYYEGKNVSRDINKVINLLTRASDLGDSNAQAILGKIYLLGEYTSSDISKAMHYLNLASKQNHSFANYILGNVYYSCKYFSRDVQKSIYYFRLAADKYDVKSLCSLGKIYSSGNFVPKNIKLAIHYFEMAAYKNDAESEFLLGMIYHVGVDVPRDMKKSIFYLKLASNQNHSSSQCVLGEIYLLGEYVKRDVNAAIYYLGLASTQNNSHARFLLGYIYFSGIYVQKDINKSIYYLTLSADQTNSNAQYILGYIYLFEIEYQNIHKGIYYLTLSSNQNNSQAQYLLGNLYLNGNYVPKDISKSVSLLTLAAEHDNPEALFLLGHLYILGNYVHKNVQKGINYITLAANLNDVDAQFLLGGMYYNGYFIEKNINKAIYYLTLSAKQNDLYSQFYLGTIYYYGEKVPRDINKAVFYFKESSSLNNCMAKNFLGIIYKNGDGVDKNIAKAIEYFKEAIQINNDPYSMYNLARVFYFGDCVKQNEQLAIDYLIKSSKNGLNLSNIILFYIFYFHDKKEYETLKKDFYTNRKFKIDNADFIKMLEYFNITINFYDKELVIDKQLGKFFEKYDLFHLRDYNNDLSRFMIYFDEKESKEPLCAGLSLINEEFYHGFYDG